MKKIPVLVSFLGMVIFFTSCFKKDTAVAPHERGDVMTDTIPMTITYSRQLYFDLSSGMIVSQNEKTNCDLGFQCTSPGAMIILNTAGFMRVADLGLVPFGQKRDTTGLAWKFDKSDGNPDSNAIGRWYHIAGNDTVSENHLYIVDRGVDENANRIGFCQFIVDSLKLGKYYFRFAGLDGSSVHSGTVAKDSTVNFLYFSFDNGGVVRQNEPPKVIYDLLFTQYTTLLFTDDGEPYPYLVTGVLINREGTEVAVDTTNSFTTFTLQKAISLTYNSRLDAIGYEWKYYSFVTGAYTVRTHVTYLVHTREGYYYKLRFIGFYNSSGVKGYPVIEYQRL